MRLAFGLRVASVLLRLSRVGAPIPMARVLGRCLSSQGAPRVSIASSPMDRARGQPSQCTQSVLRMRHEQSLLDNAQESLSRSQFVQSLQQCVVQNDLAQYRQLFDRYSSAYSLEQKDFVHLLTPPSSLRREPFARFLLSRMASRGVAPSVNNLNSLLLSLQSPHSLFSTLQSYEPRFGVSPDHATFTCLFLRASALLPRREELEEVLRQCRATGCLPAHYALRAYLRTLATFRSAPPQLNDQCHKFCLLLDFVRFCGFPVESKHLVSALSHCKRAGQFSLAEPLLRWLETDDRFSDAFCFTAAIGCYASHGSFGEAFRLVAEMDRRGLGVSQATMASLLNGCAKASDLSTVQRVLSEMQRRQIAPNAAILTNLIYAFARESRFAEVERLNRAVQQGQFHVASVYNALFYACERERDECRTLQYLRQMQEHMRSYPSRSLLRLVVSFSVHDQVPFGYEVLRAVESSETRLLQSDLEAMREDYRRLGREDLWEQFHSYIEGRLRVIP